MTISIDDFSKLDIRIGEIRGAEKVEGSEKLLRLSVSFGDEDRQIVSGIARTFTDPQTIVGRHVAFAYNLEPRTIMGLESQGMILAAHGAEEGSIVLLEAPDAPAGSRVG
ncbi:MAG TPA: methionine--tRNA ligase subunit beta [Candidatus Paceibacterota bacterium]